MKKFIKFTFNVNMLFKKSFLKPILGVFDEHRSPRLREKDAFFLTWVFFSLLFFEFYFRKRGRDNFGFFSFICVFGNIKVKNNVLVCKKEVK